VSAVIGPWRNWTLRALIAGAAVAFVGLFPLMGIPGALVIEGGALVGLVPRPVGDRAWPAAILLTLVLGAAIVTASLACRRFAAALVGWRHALAATALAVALTTLVAIALLP
jgi:hypothetical protein